MLIGSGLDLKHLESQELEALLTSVLALDSFPAVESVDQLLAGGVSGFLGLRDVLYGGPPQFEIWTKESFQHLLEALQDIVLELRLTYRHRPIRILELGAGCGKLAHFIDEQLRAHFGRESLLCIATDDGRDGYTKDSPFSVTRLSAVEALATMSPDIVLLAWQPQETRWTDYIEATPSVEAYIMIGDPAVTGGLWRFHESESTGDRLRSSFCLKDVSHPSQRCISDSLGSLPRSRMHVLFRSSRS